MLNTIKKAGFTCLVISVLGFYANAQTASDPQQAITLDTAVLKGELSNGFTYYIRKNTEPQNRVLLYLVNKVGSVLEDDDQRGLAHFMEHMNFNGTTHFPKNELINYLQGAGVRFGADLNAYTSFEETVYQLPIPSNNPEILENGFKIMRDWAQDATLDPAEIDKERGVIIEEKRGGKGAQQRMRDQFLPLLLNGSRYADRLPIGTDEVLTKFSYETLNRFYRDWYRPNLQALIVVGDINVKEMEQMIIAKFSDLKNPVQLRERPKYTVSLNGENHFKIVTDPEMTQTSIQVMMKYPSNDIITTADYRKSIVQSLFNQLMGRRFSVVAKQANPPFVNAGVSLGKFIADVGSFSAIVNPKAGELENGFKAMWREAERAKQFGFNQSELDRVKRSYLANFESRYNERNKTGSQSHVSEYVNHFLTGEASPGIERELAMVRSILPDITVAELRVLAVNNMRDVNRDILILAPAKDLVKLPDESTVLSWIGEVRKETITPFVDEILDKPLLSQTLVPGTVTKEVVDTKMDITTLTLSNGVKVILKPTTFKDNEIRFFAFSPGGTSLYPDSLFQSAANASTLITASGVGEFNSTQLSNLLTGLQVKVTPYIGERTEGINGFATPSDMETALKLTHLYFTKPRIDGDIFQSIITRTKSSLLNRGADPGAVFSDTLAAVMGNYNIRRTGPTVQKVSQIDMSDSYRIYKERFQDASDFTFIFVGSFDVDSLKSSLAHYLGSLPSSFKSEEARDLNILPPAGVVEKTVYKGSEDKATVRLVFTGDYKYGAKENRTMDALSEVLQLRLLERLREEESGVYTPGVSMSYSKSPEERFSFMVSFGCAPENVERLVNSTFDEIKKVRDNGPELANLEKFKAESQRGRELQLKNNAFWINYINSQAQHKEDMDDVLEAEKVLASVNAKRVKKAARKYLGGDEYLKFVLLPEESIK